MKNMTNEQITEHVKELLLQIYNEKGFDEFIKTSEAICKGDFEAGLVVAPYFRSNDRWGCIED